ncbi:MAG: hypothetical protein JMDDDDMK_01678 [Acidobacteria bacterium]|nr:hypothetical protein [Acidobacteriota bacterium]
MTEFVIKLKDASQTGLLLDALKRLVTFQGVDLSVEQNGQGVALDDDARFEAIVNQIIEDKLAGRLEPLTEEEQRENDEYWENVGAELNLTDDDIVRLVKEVRAEGHAQTRT